ncbi:MAG: Rrf2 family transcriptional regulator [Pirellulaceae bacterium]|nr:Rrf2 family transcriptional regulator [Pirellulaceae bacterium]
MKISRTVTYALQAVLQLAESGGTRPVPCSRLAAEGKMPERFLLQILRSMVNHGILRSTRGVEGGYSLAKPSDEISLLQVIEAIEGPVNPDSTGVQSLPESSQEVLKNALKEVAQTVRSQLSAIKLNGLLPVVEEKSVAAEVGEGSSPMEERLAPSSSSECRVDSKEETNAPNLTIRPGGFRTIY